MRDPIPEEVHKYSYRNFEHLLSSKDIFLRLCDSAHNFGKFVSIITTLRFDLITEQQRKKEDKI